MASESESRRMEYLKNGCNKYFGVVSSKPLSIWNKDDIVEYLKDKPYCSIYDDGYESTGCMFCMFGIYQESAKGLNRFQKMRTSHPKHYNVAINTFGIGKILDYLGIEYKPPDLENEQLTFMPCNSGFCGM
ncbi:phosphoadenosine phosphosulfate reductase family protein [Candidatus Pacearchaeota archaeon]|nr:phosphoadenosine phosphosulfate reductase family protein [Candidatus Pacearchaeota archaeon]